MSDTPNASSDDDSNASPLPLEKQSAAEVYKQMKNVETKEEVLKLIPNDVRVPQSNFKLLI